MHVHETVAQELQERVLQTNPILEARREYAALPELSGDTARAW